MCTSVLPGKKGRCSNCLSYVATPTDGAWETYTGDAGSVKDPIDEAIELLDLSGFGGVQVKGRAARTVGHYGIPIPAGAAQAAAAGAILHHRLGHVQGALQPPGRWTMDI